MLVVPPHERGQRLATTETMTCNLKPGPPGAQRHPTRRSALGRPVNRQLDVPGEALEAADEPLLSVEIPSDYTPD